MKINNMQMKFFVGAILLLMSISTYSQETVVVQDLETWSSLNLNYKINKKWAMALQGQLRLENNSSEVSQYFGQLDLEYTKNKHFEFVGALRYIRKNDNTGNIQGYENHFRYHLDGIYKYKLNDFSVKYRLRYQNKTELDVIDTAQKNIRFKAGISYKKKKWKLNPGFSGELFRSIGSESDNELEGYRLTLGTSFKIDKQTKMKVFYRYDKELNTTYPQSTNIIGLKYTYNLK
ncbi:DUF2490 domain-containing protein [Flavobacteriaceae bacterium]|nr:DUF2490 domain-containing protein [Flavobacteriaceae bacterium]